MRYYWPRNPRVDVLSPPVQITRSTLRGSVVQGFATRFALNIDYGSEGFVLSPAPVPDFRKNGQTRNEKKNIYTEGRMKRNGCILKFETVYGNFVGNVGKQFRGCFTMDFEFAVFVFLELQYNDRHSLTILINLKRNKFVFHHLVR